MSTERRINIVQSCKYFIPSSRLLFTFYMFFLWFSSLSLLKLSVDVWRMNMKTRMDGNLKCIFSKAKETTYIQHDVFRMSESSAFSS